MVRGKKIQRLRVRSIFTAISRHLKNSAQQAYLSVLRGFRAVRQKYKQTFIHKRLKRADKWRVRSVSVISFLLLAIFILGLLTEPVRASSTWDQSDWSGGVGTDNSSQYESASNVDTGQSGQASLSSSELFTNGSLDSDISNWQSDTLQATPALVQSKAVRDATNSTSTTLTLDATPTQGNTIIVAMKAVSSMGTVTAPSGYNVDYSFATGAAPVIIYRKVAGASESATITFSRTSTNVGQLEAFEFSGIATSSPLDQTIEADVGASNVTTLSLGPTATTTQSNEVALVNVAINGGTNAASSTLDSGFTNITTSGTLIGVSGYKVLSSKQTLSATATWVTARRAQGLILTYKAASRLTASYETTTKYAGAGSAKLIAAASGAGAFNQSVNTGDTDNVTLSTYLYTNGSAVSASDAELSKNGSTLSTTFTAVGGGWYKASAIVAGSASSTTYGLQVKAGKTVYADNLSLQKYASSGTLTSAILSLGYAGDWGILTYSYSGSGTVAVKVRTGDSSDMIDAPAFSSCSAIPSGTNLTGQSCVTSGHHFIQYQVTLTPSAGVTPVLEDISIAYGAWDTDPPDTNASNIVMKKSVSGDTVSASGWTNGSSPYFSWDAGADAPGGGGIAGYCLYLGQDSNPDLSQNVGLLGTSPLNTNGVCDFAVSSEYVNLATTGYLASALTSSGSPYYLVVKAIDYAGNLYAGSPETFEFYYDNIPPTNPSFVSAPSQFVSSKQQSLTWSSRGGDAASDTDSGVAGLQYRIGNSSHWYGDSHSGAQDETDLLANDGEYTTSNATFDGLTNGDFDNINEGNNIIYFRTWDNAGNVSTLYITTVLKLNTSSPSSPQNVTATPSTNTSNSFAFDWSAPATYQGLVGNITYCYSVNTLPTDSTCNYTAAGVTSLSAAAYATQPGENTFYVVARDEASNVNYATAASVTFTANTSAPGIPLDADIIDISVKTSSNWRLALSWDAPTDVGAGVASYKIYRSTDNSSFTNIASTSGTSYVDSGLTFEQQYYYKIKACDSANNCGALTGAVTDKPTGKYTEPASLTSNPNVSNVSTRKATIAWNTDRTSDSRIQYGLKSGQYFSTEAAISDQTTAHEVPLNNLAAGTTYYAKARWTDEDGNTGSSAEFTFRTSPAPQVKEVNSDPSLSTVDIRFTSKDAAKVKIYYGASESFGGVTSLNTSLSESKYTTSLSGLTDGTKYFFKLNTLDADGNEYEGNVYSFTTPQRPRISNLRFQPVKDKPSSTQKVTWDTNVASNSEVSYGIGGLGSTVVSQKLTTNHEVVISGLSDDSTYVLVARSRDANGNQAVSDRQTFKTDLDTRPPKITDVVVDSSIRGTGAEARGQVVLSWKTDEPSTSQVAYGEGSSGFLSSSTSEDAKLTTDHVVVVSDLSTSRVYHFEPRSYDKAKNEAKGEQKVAIIGRASENVLSIIFNALQQIFGIN